MHANQTSHAGRVISQPKGRSIDLVVIHCSATASGKRLLQGKLDAAGVINAWHAERGFRRQPADVRAFNSALPSIGYHYVIDLTGSVLTGRELSEIGAHAAGFNAHSVGICMIGGVERDAKYTAAQWTSLRELVTALHEGLNVPLSAPKRITTPYGDRMFGGVCGHRDVSPDKNRNGVAEPNEWLKTCPGFEVRAWLARDMQPLPEQLCEVAA